MVGNVGWFHGVSVVRRSSKDERNSATDWVVNEEIYPMAGFLLTEVLDLVFHGKICAAALSDNAVEFGEVRLYLVLISYDMTA